MTRPAEKANHGAMTEPPKSAAEILIAKTRKSLVGVAREAAILGKEIREVVLTAQRDAQDRHPQTAWLLDRLIQVERKLTAFSTDAHHCDRQKLAKMEALAIAMREADEA